MQNVLKTIRRHNELIMAYLASVLIAVSFAAYHGLFTASINTPTGFLKIFMIVGVFFIPFVITAIISSEMRSRNSLTDYMQAWMDISVFWVLFAGLTWSIMGKSQHFFAL